MTRLDQEDTSVADSAIKAVFLDGLKMTVNRVSHYEPSEGLDNDGRLSCNPTANRS